MKFETPLDRELPIWLFHWSPRPYLESLHFHSSLEIGVCLSGTGTFYFGEKTYDVAPGDVFVVNHLEHHIAQSDKHDPSTYLFLYFDPSLLSDGRRELLLPFLYLPKLFDNKLPGHLPAARQIADALNEMWTEQQERPPGYASMLQATLMRICALLLRHYSSQETSREPFREGYDRYMKLLPILDWMQERYREPIRLDDVAAQIKLSPSRTRHLFKDVTGEGFKEYLIRLRVNEAKRLLITTDRAIADICLACGFQSMTPFYRAFRELTGMPPQTYREQAGAAVPHAYEKPTPDVRGEGE
ncbi:MAG: AraC family transcriptional regulator [Paenibacillus sp.]|nr:AraC family transcriptional regulator [Paenibacillus sp.]